ncbi:MAG: hypothetical protein M1839_006328 [Geoglossum umbratile]|nr:MAG: hypothetical protein M1839_006328 [Geoglossum umbratile]
MDSLLSTAPPDRQIQPPSPSPSNSKPSSSPSNSKPSSSPSNSKPSPSPSSPKPSAAVSTALDLFRSHREGVIAPGWNQLSIKPADYRELLRQLDIDEELRLWVEAEAVYDYDPDHCLLAVRVTTLAREVFLRELVREIRDQLRTIATEVPDVLASFLADILDQGRGHVCLWGEKTTENGREVTQRCPDSSFRHPSMRYPRVVVEISYAQKRKPLEYLADSYITKSLAGVGVVVGVDLEYRGTGESRVMVWRPKLVTENGETFLVSELVLSQIFRNAQGYSLPGTLTLPVSDFLLPDCIPNHPPRRNVEIDFSSLSAYFTKGLALESTMRQGLGQIPALPPGTKARQRERTPTPLLSEEREE